MKKSLFVYYLFGLTILCPLFVYSQLPCTGSHTEYFLNSNNIRASFFPRGNKFTNDSGPGFFVPFPSSQKVSTIYASSPWIGGFDDAGNLKLSAETYPFYPNQDYSVGPLNSIGLPFDSICSHFDYAWNVYYEDIQAHRMDFIEDFKIDDTIPSIFGWPGRGNKFFKSYYGFELPFDNFGLAPFVDFNGNNIYDPENGDYPCIRFSTFGIPYIPDQILWMVFNDLDTNQLSGHKPLRFEIQLTAFAFHCEDNTILNNTIFNSYRILNRGLTPVDSTLFGIWTDYDLGCSADDCIGSDSLRSTEFVYNADALDGDNGIYCATGVETYASHPPIESMTYLSLPMHSFVSASSQNVTPIEFYRQLNGQWPDGTPITPEGDGNNPGSGLNPTKFLFNGDPRDTSDWTSVKVFPQGAEQRTISSVYFGRFDPGKIETVVTVYMFHYDPEVGHLDQITNMYSNIDSLLPLLSLPTFPCTPYQVCEDGDCVWPGDFNHDGIANHFDLLYWGVMKDSIGAERNGLVSWRGHYADPWTFELPDGLNAKHGDGNGDGVVNAEDLERNIEHYNFTTPKYQKHDLYPPGPDIVLSSDPMEASGRIRNFKIKTGQDLNNVLGLAYEIEYDTSLFTHASFLTSFPNDSNYLAYSEKSYGKIIPFVEPGDQYAFVQTDHLPISIEQGTQLQRNFGAIGFSLLPGLGPDDIPDSTIIRLKNLIAIDAEGNDLHIGSEPLIVYKNEIMGYQSPYIVATAVYPNPCHDFLQVESSQETALEIYSVQGQLIRHVSESEVKKPIDISLLSPGLYILRIMATGESLKVVVQ